MKTILITGGAGFIGHHIVEYFLQNTPHKIVCLDRLSFSGNLNRISDIVEFEHDMKRVKIVHHDLRSPVNDQVAEQIGEINYIFHVAASSHVTRSIKYPLEFVESNIVGTVNLLEYARKLQNLKRFIYFSTDEVFGPSIDGVAFKEHDRYNATNPYSATKAAAEEMCVAYQNTYNLPIYITHTMNVYGPRQNVEKYIPMCIKKILNGEQLQIHYNTKTREYGSRCYLHAADAASALNFIMDLEPDFPAAHVGGRCHKFNVASHDEMNNFQIAELIAQSLDVQLNSVDYDPNIDRPGHDASYHIDGSYLRSLGWQQKYSIWHELPELAQWYKQNPQWLN